MKFRSGMKLTGYPPAVSSTTNAATWLKGAVHALEAAGIENSRLESTLLFGYALGKPRSYVEAHPELEIDPALIQSLRRMLDSRIDGYPLPYLLGEWEFYGRMFSVGPGVLIPRPETELLVETTIAWLEENRQVRTGLDVGTGSGILAVTVALECPWVEMTASDISAEAMQTAARNVERNGLAGRVRLVQSDLLSHIDIQPDFLVANLPYVPTDDPAVQANRFEPVMALDGGDSGTNVINRLLRQIGELEKQPEYIGLEIEYRQGFEIAALVEGLFPSAQVTVLQDLAGSDRVARILTAP